MLKSDYRKLGPIELPYQARQKYMHTFDLANPVMAPGFEDYLEPVLTLCRLAGAHEGEAHMTVDEKEIMPGQTQRRPGPHVDGCFVPAKNSWSHGGGGWKHGCNNIGGEVIGRMPIIVAASVAGCKAWRGTFDGQPKSDGDLSHLDLGEGELLPANVGYILSPDCIHESMPFATKVRRSFLRIALPLSFNYWKDSHA